MSGQRGVLLGWALLSVAWAVPWAGIARADEPLRIEALMREMAAAPGVIARFEEERHLALLSEPLRSSGTLWFSRPSSMARVTEAPLETALLIDGETMLFREAGGAPPVDLSGDPTARMFLEGFVVIWAGDLEALRQHYQVALAGNVEDWTLTLRPRSGRLSNVVEHLRLFGHSGALHGLEMLEKGGDVTRTRLEPLQIDEPVTRDDLRAAFDSQGPP